MVCKTLRGKIRKIINGNGTTASISKGIEQREAKNRKNIAKMLGKK